MSEKRKTDEVASRLDALLTVDEAAKYIGVSSRYLRTCIARREDDPRRLPSYRVGSRIVLFPEEIRAWVKTVNQLSRNPRKSPVNAG